MLGDVVVTSEQVCSESGPVADLVSFALLEDERERLISQKMAIGDRSM